MNGRERVFAHLESKPVDRLALMPITMMFAGDQIGIKYREHTTGYHRQSGAHYIIGAGCETPRGTPSKNLRALLDYAKSNQQKGDIA